MSIDSLKRKANINSIPDGWLLDTIGNSCQIRNDLRKPISVSEREKISGSYPYYGPTGILGYINEYRIEGEYALIGEDGDHFLKPKKKEQTLIIEGRFNVNNHAHIIESTLKCKAEWFYHYFRHRDITPFLTRQGANRYKLNKATLENIPILLPPLREQTAIADLLYTWDEAIEKTERLIMAKEKQFAGFIQLLVDPHRAKVNGRWPVKRLGEVFEERVETGHIDLPLLSVTRESGIIPFSESGRKDNSNEDKSKYLHVFPGDIAYNTMRMWQGVSALSQYEGIVSPAYTVCIPSDELDPRFIAHYFKAPWMIHQFYRHSQGLTSDTWNLKFKHFREIKAAIPPLDEQKRIAHILDTARQETNLLKQQAEFIRKQKYGLMQKLLTGEWRTKPDREVA